ncbi:gliding motility-associated C-terminal domain-containing protein [Owenweeksia hongkongensis]|uniref:gliding motility-associated C-terminal domain-containing protein n=1 Tax=Owenweeksia hongkongensis TaxID=253245 RepID=UPI003A90DA53
MKYFFLISVIFISFWATGQNLVKNHDFSLFKQCLDRRYGTNVAQPPYNGSYSMAHEYLDQFHHWFSAPEAGYPTVANRKAKSYMAYNQSCAFAGVDTIVMVPVDPRYCYNLLPVFYPKPVEGNGYAGLELMDTIVPDGRDWYAFVPECSLDPKDLVPVSWQGYNYNGQRNFLETQLSNPLVAQEDYMVEFWVIRRARTLYTTGDIGAYLSQDTFKYEDYRHQTIVPQVAAQDSIYNEKYGGNWQDWHHIKGGFTAQGGEEFLTLGNFVDYNQHPHTWVKPLDTMWGVPYWEFRTPADYFFDAVYVYKATDSLFTVNLPNDTTLCLGDSLQLFANHSNTFKIQATKTFRWSTGSTDSSITISSPGTYWVEVAYNNRWKQYDTIVVDYYPTYQSGLPRELQICEGQSAVLNANTQAGVSHQWSTGSTSNFININKEGMYSLQSFTPCDTLNDTVRVSYYDKYEAGLPDDTILCTNETMELIAEEDSSVIYSWSNGSSGNSATYYQGGEATLTVYTLCDTLQFISVISEEDCEMPEVYIPNTFTPDGDGLNDVFEIGNLPPDASLQIYNRWGGLVFEAHPYKNDWRGTSLKGEAIPAGVYTYHLIYQKPGDKVYERGWVQVLR